MLDLIRKKQKSFIIKLVFWAIIAAFVGTIFLVWGKGRNSDQQASTVAVKVNGTEIGFDEYQRAYSNLYRLYQNVYQDKFTPALEKQLNLRQKALDSLVDEELLLQEADRLGIKISDSELVESISKEPAFQANGTFDKKRYLDVLAYQRLTPDQFEAGQRRSLLAAKVREKVQAGVTVDPGEVEKEFRRRNEKINLAFIKLAPALFENKVKVTDADLEAFFQENRENFRIPEKISLRYLQFEPARYEAEVTFDEGELEKYYRRHLDRYEIPEQVKASHILVKVSPNAGPEMREQKRKLAETFRDKVLAGKDFAELARKYSDDQSTAAKGGDLGFFTRGIMVEPFEKAAFSMKPGEVSDIVETPFGYHIIRCDAYVEAGVKPLADVIDLVKSELAKEKAKKLAFEKARDAYNINRKKGSLDAAATENNLGVKETGLFSRNGVIDGIGKAPEISASAFDLQPGELAAPVEIDQGIFLFTVKERQPSRLPELAEVRVQVEKAFREKEAVDLARKAAQDGLEKLQKGEALTGVAKPLGLEVKETDFFSRAYGSFVPKIGSDEQLFQAAFSLTGDNPVPDKVFEVQDQFVLFRLKERQEPDLATLDESQRQQLQEFLKTQKEQEVLDKWLAEHRQGSEIVPSPVILSAIKETDKS